MKEDVIALLDLLDDDTLRKIKYIILGCIQHKFL